MSEPWRSYPHAPYSGQIICKACDFLSDGVHPIDVSGFPVLMIKQDDHFTAFVNACPDQYLPLDYKGDALLSTDGAIIRCTNHNAGFDIKTGKGVEGLGLGCSLDILPIAQDKNGIISIS
jgi:nitrite reductase/ring-hydroxylating ferredoxin subunit